MAVGATVPSIVRMIVSEGLLISGVGLAVGLCLSLAISAKPIVRNQRGRPVDTGSRRQRSAAGDQPGESHSIHPRSQDQPRDSTSLKLTSRDNRYEETY
jgi:hypothetical protein